MERMSEEKSEASDRELLDGLLDYMDVLTGTLDLLLEHLSEGALVVTLDDGTTTDVPPLDALSNAINDLTGKAMQVRAQRAMRDGVLDETLDEVLEELASGEAGRSQEDCRKGSS